MYEEETEVFSFFHCQLKYSTMTDRFGRKKLATAVVTSEALSSQISFDLKKFKTLIPN